VSYNGTTMSSRLMAPFPEDKARASTLGFVICRPVVPASISLLPLGELHYRRHEGHTSWQSSLIGQGSEWNCPGLVVCRSVPMPQLPFCPWFGYTIAGHELTTRGSQSSKTKLGAASGVCRVHALLVPTLVVLSPPFTSLFLPIARRTGTSSLFNPPF